MTTAANAMPATGARVDLAANFFGKPVEVASNLRAQVDKSDYRTPAELRKALVDAGRLIAQPPSSMVFGRIVGNMAADFALARLKMQAESTSWRAVRDFLARKPGLIPDIDAACVVVLKHFPESRIAIRVTQNPEEPSDERIGVHPIVAKDKPAPFDQEEAADAEWMLGRSDDALIAVSLRFVRHGELQLEPSPNAIRDTSSSG